MVVAWEESFQSAYGVNLWLKAVQYALEGLLGEDDAGEAGDVENGKDATTTLPRRLLAAVASARYALRLSSTVDSGLLLVRPHPDSQTLRRKVPHRGLARLARPLYLVYALSGFAGDVLDNIAWLIDADVIQSEESTFDLVERAGDGLWCLTLVMDLVALLATTVRRKGRMPSRDVFLRLARLLIDVVVTATWALDIELPRRVESAACVSSALLTLREGEF